MKPILTYFKHFFAKNRVLGDDPQLQAFIKADMLLAALVRQGKIPGLSISASHQGEMIFQKGYGHADIKKRTPIDPSLTIFRIASVSKPIAATALAYMVSEGTIDMEASFYTYVPYFPKKKYDFTIRQLAGHTAGIRGYRGLEYGSKKSYSIKEGIEIFKDDPLLFEPGTAYQYNSYDWVLISLAMQEASGIPFEDYVQEKVLGPLGMKHTFPEHFVQTANKSAPNMTMNRASFYSKNKLGFRKAVPVNNCYKLAGGGFMSTSADIVKLGQAYLDKKILNGNGVAPFLSAQTLKGSSTYYGLGWQVGEDKKGRPFYGHVGNGVGAYSNFFVYPKEEMVFSILVNCTDPKIQEVLDVVVDLLLASDTRVSDGADLLKV